MTTDYELRLYFTVLENYKVIYVLMRPQACQSCCWQLPRFNWWSMSWFHLNNKEIMILFILACCGVGLLVLNWVCQHSTFSLLKLSSLISLSFIFIFAPVFHFLSRPYKASEDSVFLLGGDIHVIRGCYKETIALSLHLFVIFKFFFNLLKFWVKNVNKLCEIAFEREGNREG